MYQLTKEQKIENLQERKVLLQKKINNLQKEIEGIDGRLKKLQSGGTTVPPTVRNQINEPTLLQKSTETERAQWYATHPTVGL